MAQRINFDIRAFFDRQGIRYVERGANVKKGNINIKCPMCADDPSEHMGINLETLVWGCWRDADHRGRSPVKLIRELTGMPRNEVRSLLGLNRDTHLTFDTEGLSLDDLDVNNLFSEKTEKAEDAPAKTLEFPKAIKPLKESRLTDRFYEYIVKRGFKPDDVPKVIRSYGLRYALTGDYSQRLIFPVKMYGQLTGWTGRAVTPSELRYKSTKIEESVINIYDSLINFDQIKKNKPDVLFVTEGPLDFAKVDFYGRPYNCMATCIFTKIMSELQIAYLYELEPYVGKMILLLDPKEVYDSLKLEAELSYFKDFKSGSIPKGVDDPGDLSARQVAQLCRKYNTNLN